MEIINLKNSEEITRCKQQPLGQRSSSEYFENNIWLRIISFHATQIHSNNIFYFRASQDILGVDERVKKDDCSSLKEENKAISILALAENAGMSTGIVTTTRVTHATPASAYAHSANRDWEADADFGSSANAPGFNCKDIGNALTISCCFPVTKFLAIF